MINNLVSPATQRCLIKGIDGSLHSIDGAERFAVLNGVPRFVEGDNYATSFGYQWNQFRLTQLDSVSGSDLSFSRFFGSTGWTPESLENLNILEVGSGAGRFTEVVLSNTLARLYSIDYSSAVEANFSSNHKYLDRLCLAQASVYAMPFRPDSFDRVFCFGVLQHTPDIFLALKAMVEKTKVGGEIVVDFYELRGWWTKIHAKYLLRPLTKRLQHETLLYLIKLNVPWMIFCFDVLCRVGLGALTRFLPITDLRGFPDLEKSQRQEWAVMDTFDGFSPAFDQPMTIDSIISMFLELGCFVTFSGTVKYKGGKSTVVRVSKSPLI